MAAIKKCESATKLLDGWGLKLSDKSFSTDAIHAGQHPDPHHGAVIPPISLSTTYAQKSPGVGYPAGFEYTRSHGPTRNAWEANVAALEKGKHGESNDKGHGQWRGGGEEPRGCIVVPSASCPKALYSPRFWGRMHTPAVAAPAACCGR